MTPENGGRIELRLDNVNGETAEYEALLQVATSSWRGVVQVGSAVTKQVKFGAWTAEQATAATPPEWLTDDARAALKAALRTSQAEGRWPRRLTRWRPEPSP
jgi:6,7-dimethyl-8-ribityllumazine synthase